MFIIKKFEYINEINLLQFENFVFKRFELYYIAKKYTFTNITKRYYF